MTLRCHMIRESFHKTGSFPFDLSRIINQMRGETVVQAEFDAISNALPRMTQKFHDKGELSEQDFTDEGIRADTQIAIKAKPRDQRVIYQRRSLNITHEAVRKREYPQSFELPPAPPAEPVVVAATVDVEPPLIVPPVVDESQPVVPAPQKRVRKESFKKLNS